MKKLLITIFVLAFIFPSFAHADITTGLDAWYKFDEGSGTSAIDSTGHGHTLTAVGSPSYISGKVGTYAISLNGTSQEYTSSYQPGFNDLTVCAWYNAQGTQGFNNARIVDASYSGSFWLGFGNGVANSWGGGVEISGSPYGVYVTMTDGSWHHLCMTRAGTLETVYGDGGAVIATSTVPSAQTGGHDFAVGCETTGGCSSYFKGYIDDVILNNCFLIK